jgi:DNA-binding HxlR family transcriptional regulator
MAGKRTYNDRCGIARALDLVGERWAVLVVRELLLGPKRFTDLRAGLPMLGPDVLSQRLRDLEEAGVVTRRVLPPPAASRVYELTEWGAQLEPALLALGCWGSRAPYPSDDAPLGIDSVVLALKTMFAPVAGFAAAYELRLGDQVFSIRVDGEAIEASRGAPDLPDAVIDTDPSTLAAVLWHDRPVSELTTSGSRAAAKRFPALFRAAAPAR